MELSTKRLIIRSFSKQDIPSYATIVSDHNVTRFLGNGSPYTFEEATAYIEDVIARDISLCIIQKLGFSTVEHLQNQEAIRYYQNAD